MKKEAARQKKSWVLHKFLMRAGIFNLWLYCLFDKPMYFVKPKFYDDFNPYFFLPAQMLTFDESVHF